MKRFLSTSLVFAVLGLLLAFPLAAARDALHSPLHLDASVTTVISGDSHALCAIDDRLVDGVRNLSMYSESYVCTYYKLEEILRHNPNVTDVVISVGYHNLSSRGDEDIHGRQASRLLPQYFDVFDWEIIFRLSAANPLIAAAMLREIYSGRSEGHKYVGRFPSPKTARRTLEEAAAERRATFQFGGDRQVKDGAGIDLEYLGRIVSLCERCGVRLTAMVTPVHERYLEGVPRAFVLAHARLLESHGLRTFDFEGLELSEEHFLPDGDHLNAAGAALATRYFAERWAR